MLVSLDLGTVVSNGEWVEYQRFLTLPDEFEQDQPIKIKPKTGAANFSDIYIDNVEFYEVGVNSHISDTETYDNVAETYWTAKNVNGRAIDVLRLPFADILGTPENAPSTAQTYTDLNGYFIESPQFGWRWSTFDEMKAIRDFYIQENTNDSVNDFLALNGGGWSPKQDKDIWNVAIPGVFNPSHAADKEGEVSWAFIVKPDTGISTVKHNHSVHPGLVSTAPLVVRDSLVIKGGDAVKIEATGSETNVSELTEMLPKVAGGASPEPLSASIELSALELGEYEVLWSTTDLEGRIVSKTQMIVVEDTTPPVFINLSRITLNYPVDPNSDNFSLLTAMDLVDGEIEATHDGNDTFELGCYNLNWTATDSSGNSVTVRQKLQVIDNVECPLAVISGEAQAIERQAVTLSASQSTVDASKEISYKWSVESGARLSIEGSDSTITFNAPSLDEDSQYIIKLEVSDGDQSDYSLFKLDVFADPELPSIAPVAHIEPLEIVNENIEFNLDASGSFVDESLQGQFSWQVIEGPDLKFMSEGQVAKVLSPEIEQDVDVTIALTIDDGINQTSKEISFTIQNTTPQVNALEQDPYRNEKSFTGASLNLLGLISLLLLSFYRRKI